MKTTVDIPDKLFREAMRISKARTKRDAVIHALEHLVQQEKVEKALATLGTFKDFITHAELMDMRLERGKYADAD